MGRGEGGGDVAALTDEQGSSPGASHLPSLSVLSGAPVPFQAVLLNSDPTTPPAPLSLLGAALPPVPRPTAASVPASSFQLLKAQLPAPCSVRGLADPRDLVPFAAGELRLSQEQRPLTLQAEPTARPPRRPCGRSGSLGRRQATLSAHSSWLSSLQIMDYYSTQSCHHFLN